MDFAALVARVKPSIALIAVLGKDRSLLGTGSGFIFWRKGVLITCNHVVGDSGNTILLRFPPSTEWVEAKVAMRDEEHDLALLKFEDSTREPLETSGGVEIKEGMQVAFAGFPLSIDSLTTHQGILSAVIQDAAGATTYLIDGTVNPGNSGCPLMTADGKVIGVVNATRRENVKLLQQVQGLKTGAISIHGVDLVEIYQAVISNLQLGIGYAVPAKYIPKQSEDNAGPAAPAAPATPEKPSSKKAQKV